jgi:hypothetical protein
MQGEPYYTTSVKLSRDQRNRVTHAYVDVEGEDRPITLGTHGELKEHFSTEPHEGYPSVYDCLLVGLTA